VEFRQHNDIVFKHADNVDIELDVYELSGDTPRPAMIHFHGGALMRGSKRLSPFLRDAFLGWGYSIVSANYRLAPEAKWPAFKEDILDAHKWVLENASTYNIDPDRIGVFGGSAGGYLSLLLGAHARPRPLAIVAFSGYGDVAGPWYSKPDPFYLRQPRQEWDEVSKSISPTVLTECSDQLKGRFYLWCRQQGLWPKHVIGYQPPERPDIFDQACPERMVTPEYPPSFLIHGTSDTDVPYACAASMFEALQGHAVESILATMEGGPHGVLGRRPDWQGTDEPQVKAAMSDLHDFLAKHMK